MFIFFLLSMLTPRDISDICFVDGYFVPYLTEFCRARILAGDVNFFSLLALECYVGKSKV